MAVGRVELAIGLAALVVRLLHNGAMIVVPLYHAPLGGHTAFLDEAERIAAGALLPARPFTENSPYFPYVLAAVFAALGRDLVAARLLGIAADAVTAMLVARLAARRFGATAGAAAGLLYAGYGPAVFFAAELIYVPYAVLACTASIVALTGGPPAAARLAASGALYGVATGFMPALLAGAPLLAAAAALERRAGRVRGAVATLAGVALALAPVTALNWAGSGKLVPLTMSAGHAFYLGHNPQARTGYYLPDAIGEVATPNRGSIFDAMHRIAEDAVGHPIPEEGVSGFYARKAWGHVTSATRREIELAAARVVAFVNGHEPTTYADYYFQRRQSPLLEALPGFPALFALAAVGLLGGGLRRQRPLLVVPLAALASVVVFFYLARFRMPAVPFVCCFAGRGVALLIARLRARRVRALAASAAAAGLALAVARWPIAVPDSSNEWNKVGTLHLALEQYPEAEASFREAVAANPDRPDAYRNLARLYEITGASDQARAARAVADGIAAAQPDGERFRRALGGR